MGPGAMAPPGHPRRAGWQQQLGTAVLGMAACRVQGAVKGRDRHRVTSDAALLMGGLSARVSISKIQPSSLHW